MTHKGYKQTLEHKLKESKVKQGKYKDKNHPRWKGNSASYRAKHQWVQRKLGFPKKCQQCGKIQKKGHNMHWANISGKYKRELSDWIRLCSKCHGRYDAQKRKELNNN